MSLPGTHLCANHQGNYSHYDPTNCEICVLKKQLSESQLQLTEAQKKLSTSQKKLKNSENNLAIMTNLYNQVVREGVGPL